MAAIAWKPHYEVGIPELDRQHQKLVRMINMLYEGFRSGSNQDLLEKTLAELIDYAVTHFGCEEALMEKHKYPGQEKHLDQHQKFSDWVLEKRGRAGKGNSGVTGSVLIYLRQWLIEHIASEDQRLSRYLHAHGVFEAGAPTVPAAAIQH